MCVCVGYSLDTLPFEMEHLVQGMSTFEAFCGRRKQWIRRPIARSLDLAGERTLYYYSLGINKLKFYDACHHRYKIGLTEFNYYQK